ncbi:MAG: hypothetical protein IE909_19605 [Campylobacterales bacterium]|nr:hypothetical protein [Campylobacterales bacterium]
MYTVIGSLVAAGLIFIFQTFLNETLAGVFTNVLVALSASIIVSFFWNKFVLDATNHYEKSGIKDFYNDFSLAEPEIRKGLEQAKRIELFFMYGNTFTNSNSTSLQQALSKRGNEIVLMLAAKQNPFLEKYKDFWGYSEDKFETCIGDTVQRVIDWHKKHPVDSRAKFEIYEFTKGCFNYSYYKLDKNIYFIPNKLVAEKTFKPMTIFGSKTKSEKCLYNRLESEKNHMISTGELVKIYPATGD